MRHEIELIVRGEHHDPFHVLGPHKVESGGETKAAIRAFLPRAQGVSVIFDGQSQAHPAERLRPEGFFEAVLPFSGVFPPRYRLRVTYRDGHAEEIEDPYRFPAQLGELDLHLIGEGTHYLKYERLGAHDRTVDGVHGVLFALWAPNARRVSVVGDFNHWDGRVHPMRNRGASGIWELFLPGVAEGEIYKFEILSNAIGTVQLKADPYAFYSEVRPKTGSIVYDIHSYEWNDDEWVDRRENHNWLAAPVSIYEVHLGSWRRHVEEGNRWLTYAELADELIPYVKRMGFTHIELLPVMEHPFDGSWGYQAIGYFAATSRYGKPADLMRFIDRCHQEGIGVLLDWPPAHFPNDGHGLAWFDGTHLYEHAEIGRASCRERV